MALLLLPTAALPLLSRLDCSQGGSALQLLVDPAVVIAVSGGASVELGPVAKSPHNPLLQEDQPWEGAWWNTNPSVFHQNGTYHMYYTSNIVCGRGSKAGMCPHSGWTGTPETAGPRTGLLYARSLDGIRWQKPALGLFSAPPNLSKSNNIVLANAALGNGVFFDVHSGLFRQFGHAACQQAAEAREVRTGGSTLDVSSSMDGLRNWTDCASAASMNCQGDTTNNALWDADLEKYLAFTRIDDKTGEQTLGLRREARSVSPDFKTWTKAVEVLHGEANYEAYAAVPFKPAVGSRPGLYFGLGMFYNITGGGSKAWAPSADRGQVYCELLRSTTYGANWTRLAPGQPFIPHGPASSLDSHTTYVAARPFESPDKPGTMLFYYAGGNGPHSGPRRNYMMLATTPTSALAGYAGPGTVLTHPVKECGGGQLFLHHTAHGSVRVELVASSNDSVGEVLLAANESSLVFQQALSDDVHVSYVMWGNELAKSRIDDERGATSSTLRFSLASGTTLYAFECRCD
jgi:hypothetical protein